MCVDACAQRHGGKGADVDATQRCGGKQPHVFLCHFCCGTMGKTRLGYGKKNSHVFCRTAEQKFRQTQSMRDVCVDRWGRNGGGLLSCERKGPLFRIPQAVDRLVLILWDKCKKNSMSEKGPVQSESKWGEGG